MRAARRYGGIKLGDGAGINALRVRAVNDNKSVVQAQVVLRGANSLGVEQIAESLFVRACHGLGDAGGVMVARLGMR